MKKNIGILTFHDTNNFGSWLQTYGLYKSLLKLGINVEIIDYQCEEIIKREKLTWDKILKLLQQKDLFVYQFLWKMIKKQIWFYIYAKIYFGKSKKKYNKNNIKKSNSKYDIFLIGSDLVWDTRITNGDFTYMLDFVADDKRKLSYAASIGYEKLPDEQIEEYKQLLSRFYCITVREKSSKILLENLLKRHVSTVSDPTLLLSKWEWKLFIKRKNLYGKYVLIYFIDDKKEILRLAKQYARKHRYKVIIISENKIGNEQCVSPSNISAFLALIFYAQKVFTASYHGILFSLYFEKQLAYVNREPKERMRSIAEKFGIERYEIYSDIFDIEKKMDYKKITPKIEQYQKESIQELRKMINV